MNLLALLNLVLALGTLNEAKSTAFFSGYHFTQTSSVDGVVTFEPGTARLNGMVKMVAAVDDQGYIESIKLQVKRELIDGAQNQAARNVAQAYLKQVLSAADLARVDGMVREIAVPRFAPVRSPGYQAFLGKQSHFESRFASGAMLTMDSDAGWLTICVGHSDGPRIGLSFTSYKMKNSIQ